MHVLSSFYGEGDFRRTVWVYLCAQDVALIIPRLMSVFTVSVMQIAILSGNLTSVLHLLLFMSKILCSATLFYCLDCVLYNEP